MTQGSRIRHNPRIRPWREDRIIRGSELRSDRGTLFLPKLRPPQSAGSLFSAPSRFLGSLTGRELWIRAYKHIFLRPRRIPRTLVPFFCLQPFHHPSSVATFAFKHTKSPPRRRIEHARDERRLLFAS